LVEQQNPVALSAEQSSQINQALAKGDTKVLFQLLSDYLHENEFSVQDAAVELIKSRHCFN